MSEHEATCPHCASVAAEERRILKLVSHEASPAPPGDLWPRLAQRLQELESDAVVPQSIRIAHRPRLFGGFVGPIRWAALGAAVALLALLITRPASRQQTAMVRPEDEIRVVEMIAAAQPVRYVEAADDDFVAGMEFDTQRWLLVGNGH